MRADVHEGARDAARARQDRLVAAGGSRRSTRRPTDARRSRSLDDDLRFVFITSAARASRGAATRSAIAVDAERRSRSASAAGTTAPTSAPMPRIRRSAARCVANLFGAGEPRTPCVSSALGALARWLWLALVVVVLDQVTKRAVARDASAPARRRAITPFFNLVLVFNRGAAFSFLADARRLAALVLHRDRARRARVDRVAAAPAAAARWFCAGARADPRRRARQRDRPRARIGAVVDFLLFHCRRLALARVQRRRQRASRCGAVLLICDSFARKRRRRERAGAR